MYKVTTLVTFAGHVGSTAREALAHDLAETGRGTDGCRFSSVANGLPRSSHGGDIVWHLIFDDSAAWRGSVAQARRDALAVEVSIAAVDACGYTIGRRRIPDPALADGVYRALFLSARADTPIDVLARFEDDLVAMPDYIPEIRNWALSKVEEPVGTRQWTHVWEQEFACHADLTGAYMAHAYHWGYVDRWFDFEHQDFIVDQRLCHSASVLKSSVIARYQ